MKEVTEWDNKPRWMWCWDNKENDKLKRYVVCILTEEEMKNAGINAPIRTTVSSYFHCAEIEEETKKETQLTYYELSQLLKCFGVEYYIDDDYIYSYTMYENKNKEVPEGYKIRYKQGEWEEPTRETVWKWWEDETPNSDIAKIVSFLGWDKE